MNNAILNWSYDKPAEEGIYLCCDGDIEVIANISYIHLRPGLGDQMVTFLDSKPTDSVETWRDSFKFARLCVGAEAEDVVL